MKKDEERTLKSNVLQLASGLSIILLFMTGRYSSVLLLLILVKWCTASMRGQTLLSTQIFGTVI